MLSLQAKRGTRIVIMDKSGGADAISIARNLQNLSRRQAYVIAVSAFDPLVHV